MGRCDARLPSYTAQPPHYLCWHSPHPILPPPHLTPTNPLRHWPSTTMTPSTPYERRKNSTLTNLQVLSTSFKHAPTMAHVTYTGSHAHIQAHLLDRRINCACPLLSRRLNCSADPLESKGKLPWNPYITQHARYYESRLVSPQKCLVAALWIRAHLGLGPQPLEGHHTS